LLDFTILVQTATIKNATAVQSNQKKKLANKRNAKTTARCGFNQQSHWQAHLNTYVKE
jgi:hypothetical protein